MELKTNNYAYQIVRNGMKEYFKNNETPLLIGLSVGLVYGMTLLAIGSIIVKIATIYAK
jgi:hypothetical protein